MVYGNLRSHRDMVWVLDFERCVDSEGRAMLLLRRVMLSFDTAIFWESAWNTTIPRKQRDRRIFSGGTCREMIIREGSLELDVVDGAI
ncbi:hypothetical protein SAMN05216334_107118 [Nitrosomonas ureae]|uniref:Uncharacterized protein n=1 Tax=Nitrosomonas ureae TaxID=44577 RepID=A0A1H5UED9_9PROT|nr:hypothetical protein SAMN05216334_107118 [Nitrosomonas ureae]